MRLERRDCRSRRKTTPVLLLRSPAHHVTMSLESLSSDVHVHTSPAPSIGAFMVRTFFFFAPTNDQISSHCTRFASTLRTISSWKVAQAMPASTSNLVTVLMDVPVTRLIE